MKKKFLNSAFLSWGLGTVLVTLLSGCNQRLSSFSLDSSVAQRSDIIGGEIKTVRNTPASRSVVLIELLDSRGQVLTFCTASLIGPHTVLTAGHCFDSELVGPVKGFRVLFENTYRAFGPRVQRPGIAFARNPDYNKRAIYDHDVAIGVFTGTIPQGFSTVPIDEDVSADYSNELIYAYGYGRTQNYTGDRAESLLYSTGTLYRGVLKIDPWFKETPDRYFSADTWPTHLCQGDSGGPQFLEKNGVLKIIGVNSASFGKKLPSGQRDCSGRSQATKVAVFASWIHKAEQRLLQIYYH